MSSHDLIVALLAVCLCCGVALAVKAIRSAIVHRKRAASLSIASGLARPTKAIVYDKAFVYIDGKLLGHAESVNVDIERKFGVDLKAERTLRARVVSFIPQSGFEFDAISAMAREEKPELKVRLGVSGATLISNGRIAYASVVSTAKDCSRLEFEFHGEPATFVTPEHPLAEAARVLTQAADAITRKANETPDQALARRAFAEQRAVTTTSGEFVGVTPVQS